MSGYAMSETPYGTVWAHGTRPYGTIGVPRQHPALGEVNEARVNADGELELRNPAVMKGYWNMPEETAAVLAEDGWLKTGDLVRENPDGTYTFLGPEEGGDPAARRERGAGRDRGGARVASRRGRGGGGGRALGAVRGGHQGVRRDARRRRAGLRRPARVGVAAGSPPFKVPSQYEALDELPHTATGRVAKHRLPT